MRSEASLEKNRIRTREWYHSHKKDPDIIRRRRARESTEKYKLDHRNSARAWSQKNKDKVRASKLLKYGITIDDFKKILLDQCNCCAICYLKFSDYQRLIHVDHCHVSGVVRGLLCSKCNLALGHFKDKESNLISALSYLRNSPKGLQLAA